MTGTRDWVLIVPPSGRLPETIRALLAVADSPTHVRTQGNSDLLVAPYVAERFTTPTPPRRKPRARRTKED